MNQPSSLSPMKKVGRVLFCLVVLLSAGILSGCTRPADTDINYLLSEAYDCKGLEVTEMARTDSLPGIYTYIGQYIFLVKLQGDEKDAVAFYQNLVHLANVKGSNWKAGLYAPKLQDYLLDECTEAGQTVVENMLEDVLIQLAEKKAEVRLPIAIPMSGWAEFMPGGKGGWDMTIRRDKYGETMAYSAPVKRKLLLRKPRRK